MDEFNVLDLPAGTFEELEAECAIVDHRSDDREIVESLASFIHVSKGALVWVDDGADAYLTWHGAKHRIPLTHSSHDRYVTVSSVAFVLREMYDLWQLKDRLADDTHSILLLSTSDSAQLETVYPDWTRDTLVRLDLGYDYFSKIRVPFAANENHNPRFAKDAARVANELAELEAAIRGLVQGRNGPS